MRKVIYAIGITLDGCCEHTKPIVSEETFGDSMQLMRDADLLVYGRKTHQLMVPYWPDVAKNDPADEFAAAFVSMNKIVFSRSLKSAEDRNTRILRTDLGDEILRLKQEQGKTILVGGVSIPSQLAELGLIDEYKFLVSPVVAGEGRRLLEGVKGLKLRLVESRSFESGHVSLRYVKS